MCAIPALTLRARFLFAFTSGWTVHSASAVHMCDPLCNSPQGAKPRLEILPLVDFGYPPIAYSFSIPSRDVCTNVLRSADVSCLPCVVCQSDKLIGLV